MKLTHFKQLADKYQWKLLANLWTKNINGETKKINKTIPDYQATPRKVLAKNSKGIVLETIINGHSKQSGLDWPKASELSVTNSGYRLIVEINKTIPKDENMGRPADVLHSMIYELITDDEIEMVKKGEL